MIIFFDLLYNTGHRISPRKALKYTPLKTDSSDRYSQQDLKPAEDFVVVCLSVCFETFLLNLSFHSEI